MNSHQATLPHARSPPHAARTFSHVDVSPGDAKAVKVKASQEAHEAIRPALVTAGGPADVTGAASATSDPPVSAGAFLHPSELPQPEEGGLEEQQRALYDLVYRRTLASAMAESEADFTTVSLGADGVSTGGEAGDEVRCSRAVSACVSVGVFFSACLLCARVCSLVLSCV